MDLLDLIEQQGFPRVIAHNIETYADCTDIKRMSNVEKKKLLESVKEELVSKAADLDVKLIDDQDLNDRDLEIYCKYGDTLDVHKAVELGSLNLVKYYMNISKRSNKSSLFEEAASAGHLDILKYLYPDIEDMRDINDFSMEVHSAFVYAALNNHLDVVKYILSRESNRVDIDLLNSGLSLASQKGHLDMVKFLISQGANDLNYALANAAGENQLDMVKFFLSQGADDIYTALYEATYAGHLDMVKFLMRQTEYDLNDLLESSARGGRLNVMKYLISLGANDLNRALRGAARFHNLKSVQFLLSEGADDINGALYEALNPDLRTFKEDQRREIIRLLI